MLVPIFTASILKYLALCYRLLDMSSPAWAYVRYKLTLNSEYLYTQNSIERVVNFKPFGMRDLVGKYLLCIAATFLLEQVQGQNLEMFVTNRRVAIEKYLMSGYGNGWKNCDILSDNLASQESGLHNTIPRVAMAMKKLKTVDLGATMSSSHCLLATYNIGSHQDLVYLMEFGWKAILFKRIALVLKMAPGLTLESKLNLTKLPFMVAAELENGDEQYICPVIGEVNPLQQDFMCRQSYVSYENKVLRVGVMGLRPYIVGEHNMYLFEC